MRKMSKRFLDGLKANKKIRGYSMPREVKKKKNKNIPVIRKKSAALIWLEWNLQYWCNQRSLELKFGKDEQLVCDDRKWRFDFAIPSLMIAVEYEGGIFMEKSGHSSTAGMGRDIEKYTRAQLMGWQVIRVSAINYKTVLETLNALITKSQDNVKEKSSLQTRKG